MKDTNKDMKKICLGLALVLCLTFASAEIQTLGTFKQDSCVNLVQICANCSFNNITAVLYPNSSYLLNTMVVMQKVGTKYNYTLCGNSIAGQYIVGGFGDIDGVNTVWTYDYYITPTGGIENNTIIFLIFILSSAALLVIAFTFENHIFAFLSGLAFLATGVYTLIYGFSSITNQFTQMFSLIIIGLGAIITVVSSLEFIQEMSGGDDYSTESEDE